MLAAEHTQLPRAHATSRMQQEWPPATLDQLGSRVARLLGDLAKGTAQENPPSAGAGDPLPVQLAQQGACGVLADVLAAAGGWCCWLHSNDAWMHAVW